MLVSIVMTALFTDFCLFFTATSKRPKPKPVVQVNDEHIKGKLFFTDSMHAVVAHFLNFWLLRAFNGAH